MERTDLQILRTRARYAERLGELRLVADTIEEIVECEALQRRLDQLDWAINRR